MARFKFGSTGAWISLTGLLLILLCAPAGADKKPLHDAPDSPNRPALPAKQADEYSQALKKWSSLEDINQWIGKKFTYDMHRAGQLSESARKKGNKTRIYTPEEFYKNPHGVCVDLARFGVETAKVIEPAGKPAYLLINFEPVTIKGEILRRHWLMVFQRSGHYFSMADSKRPGHLDGPYGSLEELVEEYSRFRQRKVVSFKMLNTWKKRIKKKQPRPRPTPSKASESN